MYRVISRVACVFVLLIAASLAALFLARYMLRPKPMTFLYQKIIHTNNYIRRIAISPDRNLIIISTIDPMASPGTGVQVIDAHTFSEKSVSIGAR